MMDPFLYLFNSAGGGSRGRSTSFVRSSAPQVPERLKTITHNGAGGSVCLGGIVYSAWGGGGN